MWIIFFGLYYIHVSKPNLQTKLVAIAGMITIILFIQSIKSVYRNEVWEEGKEAMSADRLSTAAYLASN